MLGGHNYFITSCSVGDVQ